MSGLAHGVMNERDAASRALRRRTRRGDRAASLVEYALLVALISIVCIAGIMYFSNSASESFSIVGNSVRRN